MEPSSFLIPGAPLDARFESPALVFRKYRDIVAEDAEESPLVVGIERAGGRVSRGRIAVLPPGHPDFADGRHLVERWVKFLLWARGGHRIYLGAAGSGARSIADSIVHAYGATGDRVFDAAFFADVYGADFDVRVVDPGDVPAESEATDAVGGHTDGCRIGFDLGASDYKVAAVIDGDPVFTAEFPWNPAAESDPAYHAHHIRTATAAAAEHLPRIDAIGGSAAGIYVDNRPRAASLFRAVSREAFVQRVEPIFDRLASEHDVPVCIINDGDVAALAGSLALDRAGVLGIAMGSSEAGGYVDRDRRLSGWLNELAFCPVDLQRGAPVEEWSGDRGVGASYFSQQAVARLLPASGIDLSAAVAGAVGSDRHGGGGPRGGVDPGMSVSLPRQLEIVQAMVDAGNVAARRIFSTIGAHLGFTVPWYREFFDFDTVLLLGRVTSGAGGDIIRRRAADVLAEHFADREPAVELRLPDESTRRVGQAVAAASLPAIRVAGR